METRLLARLLGLARTVTPLAPVNAAAFQLPQLELGQSVRAQITARLADGSFRVVIKDVPVKVALPADTKTGDLVTLRLVAREPHLEFEMQQPRESSSLRLSGAGRLIGEILREPAAARPQQLAPVIAKPTVDATQLREPLARAIQRSGLFYESHQARWIEGDFPLALLAEEPQAAIAARLQERGRSHAAPASRPQGAGDLDLEGNVYRTQAPSSVTPTATREGNAEARIELQIDGRDAVQSHAPERRNADAPQALPASTRQKRLVETGELAPRPDAATGVLANDEGENPAVARELMPLVRQQLETIETRQILWQGELWPGQLMRWQIADRDPDAAQPQNEREWLTRVALELAALGGINADVAVGAHGIRVRISAERTETADALRAATPVLADALEQAGLRVTVLEVRHHAR